MAKNFLPKRKLKVTFHLTSGQKISGCCSKLSISQTEAGKISAVDMKNVIEGKFFHITVSDISAITYKKSLFNWTFIYD